MDTRYGTQSGFYLLDRSTPGDASLAAKPRDPLLSVADDANDFPIDLGHHLHARPSQGRRLSTRPTFYILMTAQAACRPRTFSARQISHRPRYRVGLSASGSVVLHGTSQVAKGLAVGLSLRGKPAQRPQSVGRSGS